MEGEVLVRFVGDTSNLDSKTRGITSSFGKMSAAMAIGNITAKAVSKGIELIGENVDRASQRIDTMNNYPKVMELFGVSADEASESVKRIDESVQGLPTSLDQAVAGVQDLFTVTGDLGKSEAMFKSINDSAMVFANGSTEAVDRFIYGYKQALSAGKVSAQDFNQMNEAIPGLMSKVAESMGISYKNLKDGLSDGSISIDQFNEALNKLDSEGTGSMEALSKSAHTATGGIQTSIANAKTALVRGVANIIKSIDGALEPFGGLTGVISKLGKVGEKVFSGLGQIIPVIIPPLLEIIQTIAPALQSLLTQIMPVLSNIFQTIMPIAIQILNTLIPPLLQIIQMILPPLTQIINSLLPLLKPIADLLNPIIKILMSIITPLIEIISSILPPFIDLLSTILQVILPPLTTAIDFFASVLSTKIQAAFGIVKPIFDLIGNQFNMMKNIISNLINFIKNVFTGNWRAAWQNVVNIFKSIMSGIANIIKAPINAIIGGINGFIKGLNKIKIPNWVPVVGGKGINIPLIPKLATGTNYVPDDMLAMIHEGEAVVPKKFNPYANGIDSTRISSMQNTYNPNIQVYNNVNIEQDPLGQLVHNIKTYSGGSPNDYNYGVGVS
jgi:tape measure domain-containing protein